MRTLLPRQGVPIADGGGMTSNPFYAFLQDVERAINSGVAGGEGLADAIAAIARALGSPDGSVANIPEQSQGGGQILGPQSIHVNGSLPNMVQLVLEGDAADPGPTFRYGTDAEGAKGWFPIADALVGSNTAALTVGADGVVTFSLPELPNTGGGTLQKTARDQYGRLAGTSEATTDDLPEGENLYFTDGRAQAAVVTQSITNGDTTHAPSGDAVFDALAGNRGAKVTGQEYLYAFHAKLLAGTSASMVFSGDSTTVGGPTHATGEYLIDQAVLNQGQARGHRLTATNAGHSSAHTGEWVSTYLATDLALNPDLYVVRWGLNDPFYGRTIGEFEASLRSGLTTIRASKSLAQMAVLLMVPSTANDTPNGRDAAWLTQVRGVVRQAAEDFQCAFIDTYTLWTDAANAAGLWMDDPFGDGRAIHPKNVMNSWIGSEISRLVFPEVLDPPKFGTYTPTLTPIANIAGASAGVCQWSRTGNVVTVSGRIDVSPAAAAGTFTHVHLSLPVASDLSTTGQLAGAGGAGFNPYITALISPDVTSNRASFSFYATATGSKACLFTFTYLVA